MDVADGEQASKSDDASVDSTATLPSLEELWYWGAQGGALSFSIACRYPPPPIPPSEIFMCPLSYVLQFCDIFC